MKNLPLFLLIILPSGLCISCEHEETVQLPAHIEALENVTVSAIEPGPGVAAEISLTRDVSYGDTGDVFLGPRVEDYAVDNSGRVYIAEPAVLHIYNPDGSYLRSLGRQGQGPGEFQRIKEVRVNSEYIHLLDFRRQIIFRFDRNTFDYVDEASVMLNADNNELGQPSWLAWTQERRNYYQPLDFYLRSDGTYLIFFGDFTYGPVDNYDGRTFEGSVFDPETGTYVAHDLLTFESTNGVLAIETEMGGTGIMGNVPFLPDSRIVVSNGELVHTWTEELLFTIYSEDGDYLRSIYFPAERKPLVADSAVYRMPVSTGSPPATALSRITETLISAELPEQLPASRALVQDNEGRLWVALFSDNPGFYDWRVIDVNGDTAGQFNWPIQNSVLAVMGDYLYSEETSSDGQTALVRYHIEFEQEMTINR